MCDLNISLVLQVAYHPSELQNEQLAEQHYHYDIQYKAILFVQCHLWCMSKSVIALISK